MVKLPSTIAAFPAGAGLVLLLAGLLTVCVRDASAGLMGPLDLSGISLVATGGEVRAFFAGSSAGFESTLRFASHYCCTEIFHNHATAVGTSISLGTYAAGVTLVFREHVVTTGDNWLTGPAGRNADNLVHAGTGRWAADASIPVDGTYVGFEDLFGGGDLDYNDLKFVLTSVRTQAVHVSEAPMALLLLVGLLVTVGLVGLAAAGRVGSSVRA